MNKCILVKKEGIDKILATHPIAGKRLLEPLKYLMESKQIPFGILEDCRVGEEDAKVEVHRSEGDLWFALEGKTEFIYGGKIKEQKLGMPKIIAVTEINLNPGDWLWIPPGQPHLHKNSKTSRLIIIKIPAAK